MMNFRVIALFIVVGSAIALFSYKLGQEGSVNSVGAGSSASAEIARGVGQDLETEKFTAGSDVTSAERITRTQITEASGKGNLLPGGKIAHFEIGGRNVKGILTEGSVVWLATSGGVIRYDNSRDHYQVFDNKTPGILSNGVFHVGKLGERLLVGTYGGGLSVLDPSNGAWKNYNIPNGLADQFVYDSLVDAQGDLWIATWSGVNRVKGGKLDDLASWDSFTVENTAGGLPNPWVYGVEAGRNGEMWFATEAGLARFKEGQWKNWQHGDGLGAPFEVVREAIQFTNDPAKASKHHAQQKSEQGLEGVDVAYNPNYIISLVVDNDGIVWCGTWGGGLARFDGEHWKNYTTRDGLPGNHIFMLYKDTQGALWIGTSKGLATLDRKQERFTTMTMAHGLFADNVFSMGNATDGSVWVGSFGGVARIAANEWRKSQ